MDTLTCAAQLRKGENALSIKFPQAVGLCVTILASNPPTVANLIQLQTKVMQLEQENAHLKAQLTAISTATKPKPMPKVPSEIPQEIEQIIRKRAAEKFPDDNSTQLFFITRETQAWKDLQIYTSDIPDVELSKIRQQAETRFTQDYSTQLFYINREVEAYKELHP